MYVFVRVGFNQSFESVGIATNSVLHAMDGDAVDRIRSACRPLPSAVFPEEVYERRNVIIESLVCCDRWSSEKDKYEVVCLIITYWMHGSVLGVDAVHDTQAPSECFVPRVDGEGELSGIGDVRETPTMKALIDDISARLPLNLYSRSGLQWESDIGLCETCERNPVNPGTDPECLNCYQEH